VRIFQFQRLPLQQQVRARSDDACADKPAVKNPQLIQIRSSSKVASSAATPKNNTLRPNSMGSAKNKKVNDATFSDKIDWQSSMHSTWLKQSRTKPNQTGTMSSHNGDKEPRLQQKTGWAATPTVCARIN
jgi:hypothetical protein